MKPSPMRAADFAGAHEPGRGPHGHLGGRPVPARRPAARPSDVRRWAWRLRKSDSGCRVRHDAAEIALGMRADVPCSTSLPSARPRGRAFGGAVTSIHSSQKSIQDFPPQADLVIGCVLVTGAAAPAYPAQRPQAHEARRGAVDVAIDQGAVLKPASRPRTTIRPSRWTVSFTIASPTCPARAAHLHLCAHRGDVAFVQRMAAHGVEAALRRSIWQPA